LMARTSVILRASATSRIHGSLSALGAVTIDTTFSFGAIDAPGGRRAGVYAVRLGDSPVPTRSRMRAAPSQWAYVALIILGHCACARDGTERIHSSHARQRRPGCELRLDAPGAAPRRRLHSVADSMVRSRRGREEI
jgi:hypothetical protein